MRSLWFQELEKMLDKKEVRLSKEPLLDDENAITIVVRMPDGSRRERRFLKTDKLQVKVVLDYEGCRVMMLFLTVKIIFDNR